MSELVLIYGITFISLIITIGAQTFVSFCYKKYNNIKNERNLTGKEAARYILDKHNLQDVKVTQVKGYLSDHYDPKAKEVRLSEKNYNGTSIANVSVACHECGHAIQDKENYIFMRIRASIIPLVNFSSYAGYFAILIGIIAGMLKLIWIGIMLEVVILVFQLITLPVEIDASKRALKELDYAHFFTSKELKNGKTVLIAAALTYVASVATTLLEIFQLVLIFGRNEK